MSTTADLVTALKKELKTAQMTYADLAQALGMAEPERLALRLARPMAFFMALLRATPGKFE